MLLLLLQKWYLGNLCVVLRNGWYWDGPNTYNPIPRKELYVVNYMYFYVHCLIIFTLSPKNYWIWSCCFCFSYGGGFRLRSCFGCIGWNKNIYKNSILYTRWLKYQHLIPVFRLLNNLCEFTTRLHNLLLKTSFKGWVS